MSGFNYRDPDEFEKLYNELGSCNAMEKHVGGATKAGTFNKWRKIHGIPIAKEAYRLRDDPPIPKKETASLADRLKAHLKSQDSCSVEELADYFEVAPKAIRTTLDELEAAGVMVHIRDDHAYLERDLQAHEEPVPIDVTKYAEREIPIGLTADNHLCSKYARMDVLEALYDKFAAAGVQTVYQGGNMIDGEARFNKFDIDAFGVEAQVNRLVETWPQRDGIVTYMVTGDDHEGWYTQREHINVGRKIEQEAHERGRHDLVHLGYMERDIEYAQSGGSARIRVIHAGGGSAYAVSYSSQKYVESLQGGDKPQIVLVGHFHKFNYAFERGVHVIQMGCTQDQTPFMRKRRLRADVGGCIMWVKQNELGIFTSVKVEWLPFFDKKFYAYQW